MQRPLQFHSPIHTLFSLCKRDSGKRCPSQRRHCCIALHCFLHGAPVNGCTLLICFRCSIARLRRQTVMAAATSSGHSIRNTCSIMASLPQSSSSAYRPPHTHTHSHRIAFDLAHKTYSVRLLPPLRSRSRTNPDRPSARETSSTAPLPKPFPLQQRSKTTQRPRRRCRVHVLSINSDSPFLEHC